MCILFVVGQGDGEMSCAQFDMEYSMYGSMHQAIQQQTLPGNCIYLV